VSAAILTAGVIAAYGRTLSVPLLFDDIGTITDNPSIRHWSTALWPPINTTAGGRPMLNLSLAINYAISGTAVWSYHALNLAIHVLAGLTLFGILRRTLAPRAGPAAAFIAFSAALLWALHPLQTESVTYTVQRAESLMGLFYLLTLYCFIRGADADSHLQHTWFALAVAACLLGMATKEVMVSAPLIVLLYDRTFLAGNFREACRRHWRVYAGLGTTWLLLLLLVVSTHGRVRTVGFGSGVSWWRYALTQFPAIWRYLKLSVWPHPLVFDYGTEWVTHPWVILPSAVVVVGLIAGTGWALLRPSLVWKPLSFAGSWFFAILAPTSLVPGNRQTAAEHRMYLALIPVVVLAVIGIHRHLGRASLPFCMALAVGFLGLTFQRNETYGSALSLWTDTVANCPENAFAHTSLGVVLEKMPGRLNDAIAQLEEAIRLKPEYVEAHYNLGVVLENLPGRVNDAIAQYQEAIRLKPDYVDAHYNLGNDWSHMPGRLDDAIAQLEEAIRLKPDDADAHYNLGVVLGNAPGRLNDAIVQYQEAIRLKPDDVEAHNNLGNAWLKTPGHLNDAIVQFGETIRLEPDHANAHFNLAIALLNTPGGRNEAKVHLETFLRLRPGDERAQRILAQIRASQP
jgi:tetratricopeptide (TPR) repeat protein